MWAYASWSLGHFAPQQAAVGDAPMMGSFPSTGRAQAAMKSILGDSGCSRLNTCKSKTAAKYVILLPATSPPLPSLEFYFESLHRRQLSRNVSVTEFGRDFGPDFQAFDGARELAEDEAFPKR